MKTLLKVVGGVLLIALALVAGALTWLSMRKPVQRPPSAEKIEATPERLVRGKYLVENVTDCLGCHSDHTLSFGFPVKRGTDGQVLRAMREGIDRNGDALFPMMPYVHFRCMADEDAEAIIAYIRTLKP